MNFKQAFALLGFVGTAITVTAAPVHAANLTPGDLGLPSLSVDQPVGDGLSAPHSAFPYSTNTFTPSQDLKVKFSILTPAELGSRGMGISSFGYFSPELGESSFFSIFGETTPYNTGSKAHTNDWLGTCGNAIQGACERTVTFKAGQTYQLALLSQGLKTYGVGSLNEYTFDQASDQFYDELSRQYNATIAGQFVTVREAGAVFIGMEDGEFARLKPSRTSPGTYYYDYQDWVVKAEAVPEPASLVGLGVVAGGLVVARRRKSDQTA